MVAMVRVQRTVRTLLLHALFAKKKGWPNRILYNVVAKSLLCMQNVPWIESQAPLIYPLRLFLQTSGLGIVFGRVQNESSTKSSTGVILYASQRLKTLHNAFGLAMYSYSVLCHHFHWTRRSLFFRTFCAAVAFFSFATKMSLEEKHFGWCTDTI